jgi:hypothetical protein
VANDPENLEQEKDESESAAEHPPKKRQIGEVFSGIGARLRQLLPRLGLHFFSLAVPLLIVGYPGYLLVSKLSDYAAADAIEAQFVGMDINRVKATEEKASLFKSKGHTEVALTFKAEDGKSYKAMVEKPWIAPGLKGKMEDEYVEGDAYTLYKTPDGRLHVESDFASANFLMLNLLMALALVAYLLFVLIRKRLSTQQPEIVHLASKATARSIGIAQLVALGLSGLLFAIVHYRGVFIPSLVYLGAYWSLVTLLALSLRLLVFPAEHPAPPPAPEKPQPRQR